MGLRFLLLLNTWRSVRPIGNTGKLEGRWVGANEARSIEASIADMASSVVLRERPPNCCVHIPINHGYHMRSQDAFLL